MTTGISPEEFERFQHQLLELREERYKLKEQKFQADRQVKELGDRVGHLDRELKVAMETISRSKKAREIEGIVRENEALRDRLTGIESNFLLQIDTLRSECQNLLSENERLQCQLETYKSMSKGLTSPAATPPLPTPNGGGEVEKARADREKESKLQLEVTKLCEEKAVLEGKLADSATTVDLFEAEKKELVDRISQLLTENASLKRELTALEVATRSQLEEQRSRGEEAVAGVREEMSQLKERLELDLAAAQRRVVKDVETLRVELMSEKDSAVERLQVLLLQARQDLDEAGSERDAALQEVEEKSALDLEAAKELLLGQLEEERRGRESLKEEHRLELDKKEKESKQVKEKLQFSTEELKSVKRKHQHQLKDMRRQLEKEVRRGEEIQAQMAEKNSNVDVYLGQNGVATSSVGVADDASSVYSTTLSGLDTSPVNPALIEADLKSVIDRLTNTQEENCDLKRQVSRVENDLESLRASVQRKDAIIEKYIGSRGGHPTSTTPPSLPSTPPIPQNASPTPHKKLGDGLGRLMDSMLAKRTGGGLSAGRSVADSCEVRQLQNVCEELMTRTLHLEDDLKLAVDENAKLKSSIIPSNH